VFSRVANFLTGITLNTIIITRRNLSVILVSVHVHMILREKKSNVYQDPDPEEGAFVASAMRKVRNTTNFYYYHQK